MMNDGVRFRGMGPTAVVALCLGLASCWGGAPREPGPARPSTTTAGSWSSTAEATAIRVVALGDSLTAGYGLMADEAYPALLQARFRQRGVPVEVANAGVSGDTSAGGLRRLDWALDPSVRVIVIALGANDALRGLPVAEMAHNLATMIERAQSRGITVILAGLEAPPNLGQEYCTAFRLAYRELSDRYHVGLLPFLLEGVAGVARLNQADGIHPNAEGAKRVADNLWPLVESAVRAAGPS